MAANTKESKEEAEVLSVVQQVRETVRNIRQGLECPICLDLVKEPCVTSCLHQFCSECILKFISSTSKPKCPLCKEPICKRGLAECPRIDSAASLVRELEVSVLKDMGTTATPPRLPLIRGQECVATARGTPGMKLHSLLHPTPHKKPLEPLRTKN